MKLIITLCGQVTPADRDAARRDVDAVVDELSNLARHDVTRDEIRDALIEGIAEGVARRGAS